MRIHPHGTWLVLGGLGMVCLHLALLDFAYDDAYIHFRIAENLAAHGVPYYHVDERLMSTSSLAWTLLLGVVAWIGLPLPPFVAVLNGILVTVGGWIWSRLLVRSVGHSRTGDLLPWLAMVGYWGVLIRSSSGLMETPMALALLGASLLSLQQGRMSGWSLVALAAFTRLELAVFVPVVIMALLPASLRRMIRGAGWFLGPSVLFLAIAFWYFGSPLPQTMAAKQAVWPLTAAMTWEDVKSSLVGPGDMLSWRLPIYMEAWGHWLVLSLPLLVICRFVRWKELRPTRRTRWIYWVCLGGILIAGTYVARGVLLFDWYIPLYAVPLMLGILGVGAMGGPVLRSLASLSVAGHLAELVLYLLGALGTPGAIPTVAQAARVQRYLEVGAGLRRDFGGQARLMTSEVGGLGYAYGGTILDGVGLVTRDAVRYHPLAEALFRVGGIPGAFAEHHRPELIVSYPLFLKNLDGNWLEKNYILVRLSAFSSEWRIRSGTREIWSSDELRIYIRRDLATSDTVARLKEKFGDQQGKGNLAPNQLD